MSVAHSESWQNNKPDVIPVDNVGPSGSHALSKNIEPAQSIHESSGDESNLASSEGTASTEVSTNSHGENDLNLPMAKLKLCRLDRDSDLWRASDGSAIHWKNYQLTLEELTEAVWDWSERGLECARKGFFIHPPHAGHRPAALFDVFCGHRTKLIQHHVQRIYNDLYQILETWNDLLDYLAEQTEAGSEDAKRLRKLEDRLTFYLMIAFREYDGLPLDPSRPDNASWPGKKSQQLQPGAESGDSSRRPPKVLSEVKNWDFSEQNASKYAPSGTLCCHCHQVLELTQDSRDVTKKVLDPLEIPTSNSHERSRKSRSRPSSPDRPKKSKSTSKSRSSSRRSPTASSEKFGPRSKSKSRKPIKKGEEDKDDGHNSAIDYVKRKSSFSFLAPMITRKSSIPELPSKRIEKVEKDDSEHRRSRSRSRKPVVTPAVKDQSQTRSPTEHKPRKSSVAARSESKSHRKTRSSSTPRDARSERAKSSTKESEVKKVESELGSESGSKPDKIQRKDKKITSPVSEGKSARSRRRSRSRHRKTDLEDNEEASFLKVDASKIKKYTESTRGSMKSSGVSSSKKTSSSGHKTSDSRSSKSKSERMKSKAQEELEKSNESRVMKLDSATFISPTNRLFFHL